MAGNVLGFQQINAAALAAAIAPTIPAGTERALIQAETASVRWRSDGTDPTASVGMLIIPGDNQPLELTRAMGLGSVKFIAASGSPLLNITYVG